MRVTGRFLKQKKTKKKEFLLVFTKYISYNICDGSRQRESGTLKLRESEATPKRSRSVVKAVETGSERGQ